MSDDMRRVRFTRFSAPYHEGELAGFSRTRAQDLVRRGVAVFDPPDVEAASHAFAAMDRKQMLAYAREHLGLRDEPPASISDDELRLALQEQVGRQADERAEDEGAPSAGFDQLDSMDRPHLEAFAKTKAKFGDIDPQLTDDELRAQIRAQVEATVSVTSAVAGKGKAGK